MSIIQMKDILTISKLCSICKEDFTSHSFNHVCDTLVGGHIFYTKISNASKYDDTVGIVAHCTNYLNSINPEKWSWIIDFEDFGIKHTLGINTGIQMSKLINKYGHLYELVVINTNRLVEQMLKIVKLTLNKEHHACIKILHTTAELNHIIHDWKPLDTSGEKLLESLL